MHEEDPGKVDHCMLGGLIKSMPPPPATTTKACPRVTKARMEENCRMLVTVEA